MCQIRKVFLQIFYELYVLLGMSAVFSYDVKRVKLMFKQSLLDFKKSLVIIFAHITSEAPI